MHRRILATLTALTCTGALAWGAVSHLAAAQQPSAPAASARYRVDAVHSSVVFKIRHLGLSNFYGRFNSISGTYAFDESDPARCRLEVEVPTGSIDTNNANRDQHLKSPEFFSVQEHPALTFRSTGFTRQRSGPYTVEGLLTLRGVTKTVKVDLHWFGEKDAGERFGVRSGLEAILKIKRTEFGMGAFVEQGTLGDDVEIIVAIEGVKE